MTDFPIDEFKRRIKVVKKLATQLDKIEDRSGVESVRASQSTSSDMEAIISLKGSSSGLRARSMDIIVETNFFGSGDEDIRVKDNRRGDNKEFRGFTIDPNRVHELTDMLKAKSGVI